LSVTHHDLCFGCGVGNVFGLQMEVEAAEEGGVDGRFFVKQDHQGPPNTAHGGIIGAALDEAMALAVHNEGVRAVTRRFEVELLAPVPVGAFVRVEARIAERDDRKLLLRARAFAADGRELLAEAGGLFVVVE